MVYHEVNDVCTDPSPGLGVGLVLCPQSPCSCVHCELQPVKTRFSSPPTSPSIRCHWGGHGHFQGQVRAGGQGFTEMFLCAGQPSTNSQPCATSPVSGLRVRKSRGTCRQKCVARGGGTEEHRARGWSTEHLLAARCVEFRVEKY